MFEPNYRVSKPTHHPDSKQRFHEHEAAQCDIVYTPFLNLKKEDHMEVGQVQKLFGDGYWY